MPSKEGLLLKKEAYSRSDDQNQRSQTLSGSLTSKTDVRFRKPLSPDTVERMQFEAPQYTIKWG